jgi:hypothetical protein
MKLTLLAAFAALLGAQAPNVDSATLKRNKEVEASRSAAPNQPIGPARTGILTGGRLMGRSARSSSFAKATGSSLGLPPMSWAFRRPCSSSITRNARRRTESCEMRFGWFGDWYSGRS